LPSDLKLDLHNEVYGPVCISHPFFCELLYVNRSCMQHLAKCLTEERPRCCSDVFVCGERSQHMRFIAHGQATYSQGTGHARDSLKHEEVIEHGQFGLWLSEAALWVQWRYVGTCRALEDLCILCLDSSCFQHTMLNDVPEMWQVPKYAHHFAQSLEMLRSDEWSDMPRDLDDLRELASTAFDDTDA